MHADTELANGTDKRDCVLIGDTTIRTGNCGNDSTDNCIEETDQNSIDTDNIVCIGDSALGSGSSANDSDKSTSDKGGSTNQDSSISAHDRVRDITDQPDEKRFSENSPSAQDSCAETAARSVADFEGARDTAEQALRVIDAVEEACSTSGTREGVQTSGVVTLSAAAAGLQAAAHSSCTDSGHNKQLSVQQQIYEEGGADLKTATAGAAAGRAMDSDGGGSLTDSLHDEILSDQYTFIQNVSHFYNKEDLSDVILKVAEREFYAHRFVLAKSSDVFRHMVYERQWADAEKHVLALSESPECQAVFDKFLRYLYTAEVSISTLTAVGILCLADKYNVRSLKELCTHYMTENARSPRVHNALCWYSWAKALHLPPLRSQCNKTMAWSLQELISAPLDEWAVMEADYVQDLLRSSELVVQSEYALWRALVAWLTHESHVEQLVEHGRTLLPLVRFPQMLVTQLYEIEQGDLYAHEQLRPLLHELLSKAYRFRSLCPSQGETGVTFAEDFYQPRDYRDLTVDTVRIQNTLRFGIQVDVRMYRGPVPSEVREGEWKITYRKQGDTWTLQLYSHETALVNSEARIESSVLILDEDEHVLHVHREPLLVCTRGMTHTFQIHVHERERAKNMAILIKPVPF